MPFQRQIKKNKDKNTLVVPTVQFLNLALKWPEGEKCRERGGERWRERERERERERR